MATISRGDVTLEPTLLLGWSLVRAGRTVTHPILGTSDAEFTVRAPDLYAGQVRFMWPDALAVPGGPWVLDVPEAPAVTMTAQVSGALTLTAEDEAGAAWSTTLELREVGP